MSNGISGLRTRRSITRNETINATAAISSTIVRVDPHPTNGARDSV
jgi:hypothetical protein